MTEPEVEQNNVVEGKIQKLSSYIFSIISEAEQKNQRGKIEQRESKENEEKEEPLLSDDDPVVFASKHIKNEQQLYDLFQVLSVLLCVKKINLWNRRNATSLGNELKEAATFAKALRIRHK